MTYYLFFKLNLRDNFSILRLRENYPRIKWYKKTGTNISKQFQGRSIDQFRCTVTEAFKADCLRP